MDNAHLRKQIVSRYSELDFNDKLIFLANIAEWLTLDGRGIEEASSGQEAAKMRVVIEVLHRITVQMHRMLASDTTYPDDVYANVLADQFERLKLSDAALRRIFPTFVFDPVQ